eukprot:TRINITY_DN1754_c0_g2_i1.p1 TRINITY_DN1754_c0_g2~~TRINITY_DN1754_c0_g2_i1.p1  ORF type:complete len:430 (-),score=57.05 TRINITY_DN1754_c0_g2_i1:229-1518(-)
MTVSSVIGREPVLSCRRAGRTWRCTILLLLLATFLIGLLFRLYGTADLGSPPLLLKKEHPSAPEEVNNGQPVMSTTSSLRGSMYYNLSCPFEWSKFSCAHQERTDLALTSVIYARTQGVEGAISSMISDGSFRGRRIFLLGDSITRQLFTAIACATVDEQSEAAVDWPVGNWKKGPDIPNIITSGKHSGFNVGSLRWKAGGELHYYCLEGFAASKDKDVPDKGEPEMVTRLLRELVENGTMSMRKAVALLEPSGGLQLRDGDVIVLNPSGVHYSEKQMDDKYNAVLEEVVQLGTKLREQGEHRPKLVFVTSATQHFNTPTGVYGKHNHLYLPCRSRVETNPREDMEMKVILPGVNVDDVVVYGAESLGELHVGLEDCTHFCMPGVPDEVSVRLMEASLPRALRSAHRKYRYARTVNMTTLHELVKEELE